METLNYNVPHTMVLNRFDNNISEMHIDIINLIDKDNFYGRISEELRSKIKNRIKNFKKKDIIEKTEISRQTLLRILKLKNYWINLGTLFYLCDILKVGHKNIKENIISIKTKNSFPISAKYINLNMEFARIAGHLLGDGGIHIVKNEGKYRIFYANKQKSLIKSFYQDTRVIFPDVKIYVRHREKEQKVSEVWLPTTASIILYSIFNMNNCKMRRVPKFVYDWHESYVGEFLRAIFDDEGYIYPSKNLIAIALSNNKLLNDVKKLLKNIGINSNPIKLTHNKKRSQMFYFYISGRENIMKFNEKVGFSHPTKSKKLEMLIFKYGE